MAKANEATNEVINEAPAYDVGKLMDEHKTKSAVIRYLAAQGMKKGDIAKLLDIRYQHVRNVLVQPLKKAQ